jgi:hypothetical protein
VVASLKLKDTTITMAQLVPAGQFAAPGERQGAGRGANRYTDLPEFCRVAATLAPSSDSDIKVEIWLPPVGWNGKFQAVGNGGWAGVISYSAMADAIRAGYATASTDTGHVGGRGTFALDHPEKLIDFAWRSEHKMRVAAKAVIAAFYGRAPRLSYWNGCSTGGRQGLKEAQKFPEDYDGIIAGAPANRTAISLWIAALKDPASYIPPSKYKSVVENLGGPSKAAGSVRLFLAPGMGHCGGGEGPNVFDKVGALERWVERGQSPEQVTASHLTDGKVDRTRPLCPYPQVAKYKGTGSIDAAASFVCAAP